MKKTTNWPYTVGVLYGTACTFIIMRGIQREQRRKLVTDINLRTELINWLAHEGRFLPHGEFDIKFQEKAMFITLVSNK